MARFSRLFTVICVIFICLSLSVKPGQAGGNSFPPLPSTAVINSVITQSGGPTYTPLGVPSFVANIMAAFTQGDFARVANRIDQANTVTYIDVNHTIKQSVMPLLGSASASLTPDIHTPNDNAPAKILGGVFDQYRRTMLAVVIWNAPYHSGDEPNGLRFYMTAGGQLFYITPYQLDKRKYKPGENGSLPPTDAGAIITSDGVCFVLGFDQVCYYDDKLQDAAVAVMALQAQQAVAQTYKLKGKFDETVAVPDLIGPAQRTPCAAAIAQTISNVVPACTINLVFTTPDKVKVGDPIMLMHVISAANLKTYDTAGHFLGSLPASDYAVFDATPASVQNTPGAVGVLFLVSADGVHNYLIPSRVVQGVGPSGKPAKDTKLTQPAIKDGLGSWRGF